jgi:hypothetical protein
MRTEPWTSTAPGVLEIEMDDDFYGDPLETPGLLAGLDASLEDIEPWQRLGDLLGHVTGEADTD